MIPPLRHQNRRELCTLQKNKNLNDNLNFNDNLNLDLHFFVYYKENGGLNLKKFA